MSAVLHCNAVIAQISAPKSMSALKIKTEEAPKLDGVLDEDVWLKADIATNFVSFSPNPGVPCSQKTEVRILYDDEALYVGAYMFDTAPDSILKQLTVRDGFGNSDYFSLAIGCYQDGQNGFEFGITPAGVQRDNRISLTNGEDNSWNAVWQCNTSITDKGWVAEYKIPYSALRFPEKEEQTWDIQFYRNIRRIREEALWSEIDVAIDGIINQMGTLSGVNGIKPPVRLSFYPYLTGYYDKFPDGDGGTTGGFSYNGGMDVKYGINDAFTLDATLIPDFGQVVFDAQVLNLSPFEVFFNENRQFFVEGTELFQKGNLFYSRRIGGRPINIEKLSDLAETESVLSYNREVGLLNSSKVSGRTKSGLGIGVLNAVTSQEFAQIQGEDGMYSIEIAPLSNYNVFVLDQNLKNNSSATLINTNVLRNGSTYDANATAVEFTLQNKENSAALFGTAAATKQFGEGANERTGLNGEFFYDKSGGKFNYGFGASSSNSDYDPNDLGFNTRNNTSGAEAYILWNQYEPIWKLNRARVGLTADYSRLNDPNDFTGFNLGMEFFGATKKFFGFGGGAEYAPYGSRDYFEPRVEGRHYDWPSTVRGNLWISSDYRKKVALDLRVWGLDTDVDDWHLRGFRIAPRFRLSDKVMLRYVYSHQSWINQVGYTGTAIEELPDEFDDQIIFGKRNNITHTNVLFLDYIMTNRMGFTANLRHYWSHVSYDEFYQLGADGGILPTNYGAYATREDGGTVNDNSFNALTLDAAFRWVFSPGSEVSVVYKIAAFDSNEIVPESFGSNIDRTFNLPQSNSVSIRLLYFIDWLDIVRGGKRIEN